MKAIVYAVKKAKETWHWHVSFELNVDKRYWMQRGYEYDSLLWLEPQMSFGQALLLKKRLNGLNALDGQSETAEQAVQRLVASGNLHHLPETIVNRLAWDQMDLPRAPINDKAIGIDSQEIVRMLLLLEGRSLLPEELQSLLQDDGLHHASANWQAYIQYAYLQGKLSWINGLASQTQRPFPYFRMVTLHRCERCGSDKLHWTECSSCETQCPYCEACLTMGRIRFCSLLLQSDRRSEGTECATVEAATAAATAYADQHLAHWGLSPAQYEASVAGIQFLSAQPDQSDREHPACFLIWAVTGAGKTEMIFPLIEFELLRGGRVCVATPRKDVVLELKPRVEKVFPEHRIVTLYGGSEQRWEQGDVTIATTHQLLRFWQKFDLIIIDELDAFPFANNPMLEYAAQKACKPQGRYIFLSATPPRHLQQAARNRSLPHVKVPVRYHRHPLPVPVYIKMKPLHHVLQTTHMPTRLQANIQETIDRGAQMFIFVPAIKLVTPLVTLLRSLFAMVTIEGTSSKDPERTQKVQSFRDGQIRLLVTTTILERGVTVPKTDVLILDADSALFDEAALVQMSGRAGRSKDDPAGKVTFAACDKTASQAKAVKQIKTMNRLAGKKGFLMDRPQ